MIHSMIFKLPNTKRQIEQEYGPFVGLRSGVDRLSALYGSLRRRASLATQAPTINMEVERADVPTVAPMSV